MSKKIANKISKFNDSTIPIVENTNIIEIKNFRQIEEYCCNGYQEYFNRISDKNLELYKSEILNTVLKNEDIDMLKYFLNKFEPTDLVTKILYYYKRCTNCKELIQVITEKCPKIIPELISNNMFKNFISEKKLEFVELIYELRKKNNLEQIDFSNSIPNFFDINVLFWLIDQKIKGFDFSSNSKTTNNKIQLIRNFLCDNERLVTLDNLKKLIEKINFNPIDFEKLFHNKSGYNSSNSTILHHLIIEGKIDIIYYLFEYVKPSTIINSNKRREIINALINLNDFELFMFMMKHLNSLKLLNDFSYWEQSSFFNTVINSSDNKIIYELIKLKFEPPKTSKYYDLYVNIKNFNKI